MAGRPGKLPYLRLVETDDREADEPLVAQETQLGGQSSLFSDASDKTLGFITASEMNSSTFQKLLEEVRPGFIFDIRQVPNFSRGHLTRRTVFTLFDSYGIKYFDVAGALGVRSARDAALNPQLLIPSIMFNVLKSERPISGPVLFFLDNEHMNEAFIEGIQEHLPHKDGLGWDISVWEPPSTSHSESSRNLVFISHANPEDNEIARWFATRLAVQGYQVWSDITRLTAGEIFWDSIEDVIRNRAAKVIVLLSEAGHEKPGVLDEINVAIATERRHNLDRFVIPIRIDELPHSSIRANLSRKNVIDGNGRLASALFEVVELLKGDGVPRDETPQSNILESVRPEFAESEIDDREQWELLVENKVAILSWPKTIKHYSALRPPFAFSDENGGPKFHLVPGPRGSFTFADKIEVDAHILNRGSSEYSKSEAITASALDGSATSTFKCEGRDLSNALTQLVRRAWNSFCEGKGLKSYRLSNNHLCWYEPNGFAPKNEVRFLDHQGRQRRRAIAGRSEARSVYWHFGLEAQVSIEDQVIRLKPHVVFTEDGSHPITSPARQHSLRRGFCRNWWNDRWRDLLSAMLSHLSDGEETIDLAVSSAETISIAARLSIHQADDGDTGSISILAEPQLAVGYSQQTDDAREGLMLFGPVPFERNPGEVRVGVVGTSEGLALFDRWCTTFNKPIFSTDSSDPRRNIPFPGFEPVFGASWPNRATANRLISRNDLLNSIRMRDRHQAVHAAVDLFVDEIRKATIDDDVQVDIWFIVIPEEVYLYGRPQSRVPSAISLAPVSKFNRRMATRFSGDSPSIFPEDNAAARIYEHHADFHHQLKARLLKFNAVTQILRESSIVRTLEPIVTATDSEKDEQEDTDFDEPTERRMQDPLNVSWNIATACFFKAGGRPWKVTTARPGVCYVGLIFKNDPLRRHAHACCGAQLFLDSGEGLVFKGATGPWYSEETGQFHLSKEEAEKLMARTLEAYEEIHGVYPNELFVHGRTRFSAAELDGFKAASNGKTEITGVRITRTSTFKLFSSGEMPVKRGTALLLSNNVGLLWTSGYLDRLKTYQGRETPNPLRIEICGSTSSELETVLNDVFALTKMNFNSSIYADGFPVTMRFADAIGNVLMATGDREYPPLPFKYYI